MSRSTIIELEESPSRSEIGLSKDDPLQQVFGFNEAILSKRPYQRLARR
jgi:hypothetical protein